jgi:hypothetical protein
MTTGNAMSKAIIAAGYICVLLTAGCYLGDPSTHRAITVALPAPQNGAAPSAKDPDVQAALNLIDDVMVSNGYDRNPNPLRAEDQARGLVASYGICGAALSGRTLTVGCVEQHKTQFSPSLEKAMDELQDALTRRYGKANVSIED